MSSSLPKLPSFRRQQLLLDFSIYKDKFPEGVYLSVVPGDPTRWSGVCFIRRGLYASALLRFQIAYPDDYPEAPPLITIATDLFHPLLVPLTTYSFSSGVIDSASTVSATDEARLPPGAFCLRHEFPGWFGNARRATGSARTRTRGTDGHAKSSSADIIFGATPSGSEQGQKYNVVQVLEYLKSAFEEAALLDNLPLEYAGNPGAWHAWRAYRALSKDSSRPSSPVATDRAHNRSPMPKHPGEWNWDGVWEARVKHGIEASFSEATIFGNTAFRANTSSNEPIRFAKFDDEKYQEARTQLLGLYSSGSVEGG